MRTTSRVTRVHTPAPSPPAPPAPGPDRHRGPLPYLFVGVALILLVLLLRSPPHDPAAHGTVVAYPTLTPVPTDTPPVFPDSLLPADLPPETAIALMTNGTPFPSGGTDPLGDVPPLPTPEPTVTPVPSATPRPPTPRPTVGVVRDYWEVRADGNLYHVEQLSDGTYRTIGMQARATPTPVHPAPTPPVPHWVSPVVPTPTPGYHLGTLVWRYTSPGWVPVQGVPVHFTMQKGDTLIGSVVLVGAWVNGGLEVLGPWEGCLTYDHVTGSILITWVAERSSDYVLWFGTEDPNQSARMRLDIGVYRP